MWNLWINRNNNNINNTSLQVALSFVLKQATEYKLLIDRESNTNISIPIYWTKPKKGWYKLTIDGAFKKGENHIVIGGIMRNSNGD